MLEGLEISEVLLSELEYSARLDSEYYRPHFLKYENTIRSRNGKILSDISNFLIGPFGSAFTVDNYTDDKSYRYIRGKDVKPMRLMEDDNVYMPKEDYYRLSKYALKENDILISVVGTLGNAAIVHKENLPAIFSCKSTVLRTKNINPRYLLSYLNSKYGRDLLLRKERGAIQKGLNLDDLKNLDIYLPSKTLQDQIAEIVIKSHSKLLESQALYSQAEELLLEELGLKDWQPSTENINEKSFSESFLSTGRLDAEYYQPKYEEIIDHIKEQNYKRLGSIVTIAKSIEPGSDAYQESGIPFVRVSNLTKFGLTQPDIHLSKEEYSDIIRPKKDTILLSKDGSVGIAYKIEEDLNSITSGAILHLVIHDKNILPDYLTLVLNSLIVRMQAERDAGGSIIQHWKPSEIEEVLIPILDDSIQQRISSLIQESFKLKRQSEQLLEVAKHAVEIAIEQNEEVAMEYIKSNTL